MKHWNKRDTLWTSLDAHADDRRLWIASGLERLKESLEGYPLPADEVRANCLLNLAHHSLDLLDFEYRQGRPLEDLVEPTRLALLRLDEGLRYGHAHCGRSEAWPPGEYLHNIHSFAFALCLLPEPEAMQKLNTLIDQKNSSSTFDLLLKAFMPARTIARKPPTFPRETVALVYRCLAAPPSDKLPLLKKLVSRQAVLAKIDTGPLFFAYEAALIVCAWDLDDTTLRDSPFYPHDMVDYYRKHVRHTRDAWRPIGAGAGVEIPAPPPPRKIDLARSKKKGLARWLELACNGDAQALETANDALAEIKLPRKFKDISALSMAVAESGHGIHADIKDDDSAASLAISLAAHRGDEDFQPPAGPPHGPARISRTLRALDEALRRVGHQLISLDNQDDAWHLVAVADAYADELLTLSATLGIVARPARDVNLED